MNKQNYIKWALEVCTQEGYKNPADVEKTYNDYYFGVKNG
jgi:hypothetical protein